MRRTSRKTSPGFVTADVVMGLMIIVVLAMSLALMVSKQHRGAERLADTRGAVWAAERALATLQSGKSVDDKSIAVEPFAGEGVPAGHAWVRVRATFNGRSATLAGLVPAPAKEAK
jgi:hypothetical protein